MVLHVLMTLDLQVHVLGDHAKHYNLIVTLIKCVFQKQILELQFSKRRPETRVEICPDPKIGIRLKSSGTHVAIYVLFISL